MEPKLDESVLSKGCCASPLKGGDEELPLVPPRRGEKLYMVPQGIRPVVQLTAIEVNHLSISYFEIHSKFSSHELHDETRQAHPFFGFLLIQFSSNPSLPFTICHH